VRVLPYVTWQECLLALDINSATVVMRLFSLSGRYLYLYHFREKVIKHSILLSLLIEDTGMASSINFPTMVKVVNCDYGMDVKQHV
jgi:hypothetical protein